MIAVDLDALGDTRRLWRDWLADASRLIDVERLPENRRDAAADLDSRGAGNWRTLLERFAEDRAPVYLRPAAEVSAALRALEAQGAEIVVFTDAPAELARVALAQLGAARRIARLEVGPAPAGAEAIVTSRAELLRLRRSA